MERPYAIDGICPVCGDTMLVTRLGCGHCGSSLEGVFSVALGGATSRPSASGQRGEREQVEGRFGRLALLDAEQIEFVEVFLRCRGVIKNVEDMLGISYPTVKARLGNALEAMGFGREDALPVAEQRQQRRDILADLAAARITTEDAHRLLALAPTTESDNDGSGAE